MDLASLDAKGRLGNWQRLNLHRGSDSNPWPSFSPDGQNIAFVQEHDAGRGRTLVLHNLSTGQEREVYGSDAETLSCYYANHIPKVFCSERKTRQTDLLAIAVESGEVKRLGSIAADGYLIRSSHDDQALYLETSPMADGPLVRWDLATRRYTVVTTQPPDSSDFLDKPSPDDRWVVRVSYQGSLSMRAMSGEGWRSLVSLRSRLFTGHVAITPDGNWILYHDTDMAGKPGLFRVPIAGGQAQRVGDFPGDSFFGSLAISPDDRQILAVTFGSNWGGELWILEHFVPFR